MTEERFYRGGSRSPFRTGYNDGNLSPQPARDYVALIAPGTAQDYRIKRLALTVMLPKGGATSGWIAFLRVPDQGSLQTATLDIDAPSVLRPKVFITNPDHAIYVEAFMEAINIAAGEVIGIIAYGNATVNGNYAAKWYVESQLH